MSSPADRPTARRRHPRRPRRPSSPSTTQAAPIVRNIAIDFPTYPDVSDLASRSNVMIEAIATSVGPARTASDFYAGILPGDTVPLGGRLVTPAVLTVTSVLAGDGSSVGATVPVLFTGGMVGDRDDRLAEQPIPAEGAHVVVFLRTIPQARHGIDHTMLGSIFTVGDDGHLTPGYIDPAHPDFGHEFSSTTPQEAGATIADVIGTRIDLSEANPAPTTTSPASD